eukprot:COSAG01_NODE_1650_length_9626_cov_46.037367_2_plen_527_part_00
MKTWMSSPFLPTPAGTAVQPSTQAKYYYRQQVFSRNPVTGANFGAGKTVNFNFEASPHYFVPQETRIVAKLTVKAANGAKLSKSVRFAADPINAMWSSSMLSINGTTVESHAANCDDVSRIQIRTEQTKAGADGPGSAGLLSLNQTMTREERTSAAVDVAAGGTLAANDANDATTRGVAPELYETTAPRSDKHELLLKNCSADAKNADGSDTEAVEISAPLGQTFAFCRQDKAFIPNVQVQVSLVVSEHFAKDMFFSEQLRGGASSGGVKVAFQAADTGGTAATPILKTAGNDTALTADATLALFQPSVAAVDAAPQVTVDELFLDVMMAVPSSPLGPIPSMQIPYQGIEVYTRTLAAGSSNFTESFSSIPASLSALVVGLRTSTHGINQNRELYSLGGSDTTGIKTLSVQVGSLILPRPSTPLDMSNHQIGRLFADWLSFTGGSYSSGVGGDSLTEFVTSPLVPFRILQSKGEYSSTALIRLETKGDLPANSELVLWVIHSKVFEAFWQQGEIFPNRVIVDDVLN